MTLHSTKFAIMINTYSIVIYHFRYIQYFHGVFELRYGSPLNSYIKRLGVLLFVCLFLVLVAILSLYFSLSGNCIKVKEKNL